MTRFEDDHERGPRVADRRADSDAFERDLDSLFEPHRPDATDFLEATRRRIAEKESEEQPEALYVEERADRRQGTGVWQRVAALLPLDPSAVAEQSAGAGAGALLGKFFGSKLLPAALVLPAAIAGAAVGAFASGARSVRRSIMEDDSLSSPSRRARAERPSPPWWATHFQWVFLAAILLGRDTFATDAIAAYLAVTMLSLGYLVRGLGRSGLLRRVEVARTVNGVFLSVVGLCFLNIAGLGITDGTSRFGIAPALFVLLAGWLVIQLQVHGRLQHLAVAYGSLTVLFLNVPAVTFEWPGSVRRQLAEIDLDPEDLSGWDGAAAAHLALEASGQKTPERPVLARALNAALRRRADLHPTVISASMEMGLLGIEEWRLLAAKDALPRDLVTREVRGLNTTFYYRYQLTLLLATRNPSEAYRRYYAEELLASWPEEGDHGALHDALFCILGLERLGRTDLVADLAPKVLRLVEDHWVADGGNLFGNAGGFTSNPKKFNTSFVDDTVAAIQLMDRFGVPDRVDLFDVRRYLRREARGWPLYFEFLPSHQLEARAALLHLERGIGLPERSVFELLLAERLLIASLLTVVLALYAVRHAPAHGPCDGPGARP